jgi:TetR/AcrR family transcriptional regulator, transcriptional repressor for nem operon
MSRASQADALKHKEEVVAATSKLLRERGSAGVRVQDAMSAAGLTNGGFYKHFGSKDELLGIAAATAFDEMLDAMSRLHTEEPDAKLAGSKLLDDYLSKYHRDNPETGCGNTALATDSARVPAESSLHHSYIAGVHATLDGLAELMKTDERDSVDVRRRAIEHLATMVGSLTLSRATKGDAVSDELLQVVRESLQERW